MALPPAGSYAPDFALPSTSGAVTSLASLRGRNVLLAFFPAAFTRVCTIEMCSFRDDIAQFASADTVVLPISVDPVQRLLEFRNTERLPMELLSDPDGEVSRRYGVYVAERGVSNRAYVLIDRGGTVRWTLAEEHGGHRRENAELLAEIAKLA